MPSATTTPPVKTDQSTLHSRRAKTVAITLAVLGVFVAFFPINGVSNALHTISLSTGAETSQLQWISSAYVIALAATVLSAGVFGDIYGRRRAFLAGTTLVALGGTIAAAASTFNGGSLPMLVTGQAVAGIGAGILLPTTLAIISFAAPDTQKRSRYIALWATGTGAGLAAGPLSSGLILEFTDWGWIFLPPLSLALLAAIIAFAKLPESTNPAGRSLDIPGQFAASLAIIALCFGVIEGGAKGWTSTPALSGIALAIIAFIGFITIEKRTQKPLMNLDMFKIPSFSAATFGVFMALFSIVGVVFVISIYLGAAKGLSAMGIALCIIFVPGVAALVNPIIGRLSGRIPAQYLLAAGLLLGAVATLTLSAVDSDTSYLNLVWRLGLFGVANAMMLTAAPIAAINAVPPVFGGMAGTTNTAIRQIGAALGPAVMGTVYAVSMADAGGSATEGLRAAMLGTTALLVFSSFACTLTRSIGRNRH